MEALRSLDTNVDGVVDAADAQFADLRLWRDTNGDGVSQVDELSSLDGLGIVNVSVREEILDQEIDGQQVYAGGMFTYSSGATGDYVGVNLSALAAGVTPEDTSSSDDTMSADDLTGRWHAQRCQHAEPGWRRRR